MIPKRHCNLIESCAKYSNDAYSKTVDGKFIEAKETDTQAFVSFKNGDLIISGQGTTSMKDWSIDFQIWRTKVEYLQNTQVHSGFVKAYNSIRLEIHMEIAKYQIDNEIKRIICTGHSLFGAIATICALDCAIQYDIPVFCITFGSPRVGSKQFVKVFNNYVEVSYRCVRHKDPISFTPLPIRFKHVKGGIHFGKSVTNVGSESLSIYNCCGCRVSHHSMDDYYEFSCSMNKLRSSEEK